MERSVSDTATVDKGQGNYKSSIILYASKEGVTIKCDWITR